MDRISLLLSLVTRKIFLSLVIVISVLACATSMVYKNNIYIHTNNGTGNPECLKSNSSSISCNSLSLALNVSHRASSTQYILSNGTHYLDQSITTFEGLNMIAFSGSGNSYLDTVIYCTSNKAGLAFENITDIVFSNITFYNCSAIRNSTSKNLYHENSTSPFYVALYFYSCRNVNMSFIKIDSSPSATGVVMYDTDGTNTVTNCVFSNNSVDPANPSSSGGGGFYVEFSYCIPGDINCKDNQTTVISHISRNTEATYLFNNCSFLNNSARTAQVSLNDSTTFIVPFRADHVAFGRGGGLSIFVKGNASNNLFVIHQCRFINNSALWGAGLFVEFHDDTLSNVVNVTNSQMEGNQCYFTAESGTSGGGMRLGHYVYGNISHNENTTGNRIRIYDCTFLNNSALNGGGLSISPTVQSVSQDQIATVLIIETDFKNNHARLGAALHIDRFVMILDGLILTVFVDACTFDSNSVNYIQYLRHDDRFNKTIDAYQTGVGAVYVNQVPVSFDNDCYFISNKGSALAAIGTSLDFSDCTVNFDSNMGYKGGAIALLGMAYIKINKQTTMRFYFNVAIVDGGAIYNKYIERENLISYGNCFIRHTKYLLDPYQWEANFDFYANYDQGGAHANAIHTTSVLPCTWGGGSLVNQGVEKVFCWNDKWFYAPTNCSDQISTDVGNISTTLPSITSKIEAFPGQQFDLPITIMDDLNRNMSHQTVFSATLNDYKNQTTPTISYVWGRRANVSGKVNTSVKLLLDGLSDRGWHIDVHINLKDCPPGFKINNQGTECICADNYFGSTRCVHDSSKAYLKNNNWMGFIPEYKGYVVALCPPKYCYSNESSSLPNSSKVLEKQICGKYNRQGILCGECLPGYGIAINSPYYECINCTDESIIGSNIAKYIAAVYIPLTAFFTIIILFNIRFTSGPANAFILYSQLITTTFDLSADGQIPVSEKLLKVYRVPYGIFDLQFFERFVPQLCVGKLNALDVITLDYAVAVFPLLMIIFVIVFIKVKDFLTSKCCNNRRFRYGIRNVPNFTRAQTSRRRWKVNEAILPAFATFLLLSYNKFSTTSSYLVGSQPLISDDGKTLNDSRVYFAGTISFSSDVYHRKYLPLACVVFATFVAIPPLLLLDFPIKAFEWCISKVDCLWRHYPADKVQILLDTFQGCYKNKMRFFSGLYFLFRLVINTAYLTTNSWLGQYFVQQMACAAMITLLIICQPYNKENKIFNTIDTLIFLNLGILNSFSFYLYSLSLTNPSNIALPKRPFYVQYFLVFLPLVYMLGYVIWYFIKPYKLQIKHGLGGLKERIMRFNRKDYRPLNGVAHDDNAEETETVHTGLIRNIEKSDEAYSEDEALLRRAESRNRYRSRTCTIVGISDETEGEAAIQTVSSNDSGVRSVLSTPSSNNYGSNGNTPRSNNQTNSTSDSRPSVEKISL